MVISCTDNPDYEKDLRLSKIFEDTSSNLVNEPKVLSVGSKAIEENNDMITMLSNKDERNSLNLEGRMEVL